MRMSGTRITVVVGALLLMGLAGTAIVAQGQKSAEELYQSALVMKEGRGDLEGAIKLFTKILADFPKERTVTGKAQLQIGLCYEKLGEAKAQEAYRKVIAEFQDQPEAVKVARERLTALSAPAPAPAGGEKGMTLRQVDDLDGPISSDGRWTAPGLYEPNISIYEIATKKKKALTRYPINKGYPFIDSIEWAPSNRRLSYSLSESELSSSVHIIDLAGANDRTIYKKIGSLVFLETAGWSKDESSIFLIISDNSGPKRRQSVGKLVLGTEEFQELKAYEGNSIGNAHLSPDGRFLAFSVFTDRANTSKYQIITLAMDKGVDTSVYEHPELGIPVSWTPDGSGLIFTSRRSGTEAIWILPILEGKAAGEARLIKEFSASIHVLGMANGALYLNELQGGSPDAFMAQVDLATGKTLKDPEPLEKDYRGVSRDAFWSSDGRSIAYFYQSSHRPGQSFGGPFDTLRIRSLASGQVKDIHSPSGIAHGTPRWSRDGKDIYVSGMSTVTGVRAGFFRIDTTTGESQLVLDQQGVKGSIGAWTADGRIVYLRRAEKPLGATRSEALFEILLYDLETQKEQALFRTEKGNNLGSLVLSDDDNWLGFYYHVGGETRKFCVIPAQGGEVRVVYEQKMEQGVNYGSNFFWGPPGKGLFFREIRSIKDTSLPAEIWYIPSLDKAEPGKLDLRVKEGHDLKLRCSPDGKAIVFQAASEYVSKFWVLENFLPPVKSGK